MSEPVIRVENLSKVYTISHQGKRPDTFRDTLSGWFKCLATRNSQPATEREAFHALKDVSFEVKQGEVLGIIGRNGAGKSTLLKVLSRITEPTSGRVEIRGRVASLLEVGTGFHPELTGRENIFLNGAILGMSRGDIRRRFENIVEFAGVEKFLDTPVKRYSSGMRVRLGFAVAAHLDPEIMLVDEVLSVGDAEFQKRCLGKMQDLSSEEGRTIFFVSHNLPVVASLTNRAMLMENGRIVRQADTESVIEHYLRMEESGVVEVELDRREGMPGVTKLRLETSDPGCVQSVGEPLTVWLTLAAPVAMQDPNLSLQIVNSFDLAVAYLPIAGQRGQLDGRRGNFRLCCRIPSCRLYPGHYRLRLSYSERASKTNHQKVSAILPFEVTGIGLPDSSLWPQGAGMYLEESEWQVEELE